MSAVISILFMGDTSTVGLISAAVLMALGVWLDLTEHHGHEHRHEELVHAHPHYPDIHHRHGH